MNGPPSREEVDAKLETARMTSEAFFARMDERCARLDARCDRMEAYITAELSAMRAEMKIGMQELKIELFAHVDARLAKLRRDMVITAISSTLAIILGVGAINVTVFTGMLSAMSGGKEVGAMLATMQHDRLLQAQEFAKLKADLDARFEREREERERAYRERRQQELEAEEAAERAHQQRMRALRSGKAR